MKYFSVLIKPASSQCNMKCKYCFYHDISSKREIYCGNIMTNEISEMIIHKVLDYFSEEVEITFAFQGGEPTLAGIEYFKHFTDYVNSNKKDIITFNTGSIDALQRISGVGDYGSDIDYGCR